MAGIGLQSARAQQDQGSENILGSAGNPRDGLMLEKRSTSKIQNTTATIQGEGLVSGAPASAPARERALAFLNANAAAFGLRGSGAALAARGAEVAVKQESPRDELGIEHVRLQQLHGGVPVTGGELLVHLKGERVVSAQSEVLVDADFDATPKISPDNALKRVQDLMRRLDPKARSIAYSTPRLEVLNRGILEPGDYPTQITYFVEVKTERLRQYVWVSAKTGAIVLNFNQIAPALNRKIYTADSTDALPGRLIRSEGGPATGDPDADLAYLYAGDTYNYYFTQHGRDSFDGAGGALISTVHSCSGGCPLENAFWNGTQMVYGEGYSKADDVVGHELTHAVTERTAGLFYYMQSGALNESYSDIFGEAVDLWNGRGNDASSVRWKMGEDLPIGAIRDMMNPWTYGNPGKVSDPEWVTDESSDQGGVHTNSGVPNLAFALMVDGGGFNGRTITAIGTTAAGKIQYRALTRYLTSGANFIDNYKALIQACQDLIGTSGITATTCTQVKAATEAVEMNGVIPYNTPVPAFCSTGETPTTLFEENFEGTITGNWTKRTLRGTGSWVAPDTDWAKSGSHMAWGEDFAVYNDATLEMAKSFTIPARGRLQFNHAYAFESGFFTAYDGAVIEFSEDGGATWKDAGYLIAAGDKYNPDVKINTSTGNSLAGRPAFVRNSHGYTASQLDLTTLAGKNVRFRFRVGTDELVGDIGWVVDDVKLYSCSSGYTISGHITKAGAALPGVTVTLTGGPGGTRTTDATGAFSFTGLPAGANYTVTPTLANHVFTPVNLSYNNLQANQTAANFTAAAAYTISGHVTKAGAALAGVTITLAGGPGGTRTTDASGAYSFANLPAGGNYTLTPSIAGNSCTPTNRTYNNLLSNQTTADFTCATAYTISGRITKAGTALAGVSVRLTGGPGGTRTTDATGAYSFTNLPAAGNYTLTPTLTGFAFTPTSLSYNNLQANQTAANFTAVPAFTISGRITKAGAALAGVSVRLTGGPGGTRTTDANGAYSFTNLPSGVTYTLTPSLTGNLFTPASLSYANLQANQTAANFTAATAFTISGQVSKGGTALAGVTIRLTGGPGGTRTTDAAGMYSFTNLPSGATYTLTPTLVNHSFTPATITYSNLQANQSAANFVASPAFTISGRITKGGASLAGVSVKLTGGPGGTRTTDVNGAYSFTSLPAGLTYTVTPSMANHKFTPTSLSYSNLQANQTAANFTATASYMISGRITKGGVALSGVTVTLTGGPGGTRTTDANGAYSFANLPAGATYTVKPTLSGHVFTPVSLTYSNLQANQAAANFTAAAGLVVSERMTPAEGSGQDNIEATAALVEFRRQDVRRYSEEALTA